jgi:hypothetical protein
MITWVGERSGKASIGVFAVAQIPAMAIRATKSVTNSQFRALHSMRDFSISGLVD